MGPDAVPEKETSMSGTPPDATLDALKALAARIDARLKEFKENGAFSDADAPTLAALTESRRKAQARLDAAVAGGSMAAATEAELRQDFHEVMEHVTNALQGLEARAMKRRQ